MAHYAVENASFLLFVGLLILDERPEIILSVENGYVHFCLQAIATLLLELFFWPDFSPCPAITVNQVIVSEIELYYWNVTGDKLV